MRLIFGPFEGDRGIHMAVADELLSMHIMHISPTQDLVFSLSSNVSVTPLRAELRGDADEPAYDASR